MVKKDNKPDPEKIKTLGKLIFDGAIFFLTISFGIFTFAISSPSVNIADVVSLNTFVIFVLLFGISSLALSFFGIKYDNIICIYIAGICLFLMILFLAFAYWQIYSKTISKSVLQS